MLQRDLPYNGPTLISLIISKQHRLDKLYTPVYLRLLSEIYNSLLTPQETKTINRLGTENTWVSVSEVAVCSKQLEISPVMNINAHYSLCSEGTTTPLRGQNDNGILSNLFFTRRILLRAFIFRPVCISGKGRPTAGLLPPVSYISSNGFFFFPPTSIGKRERKTVGGGVVGEEGEEKQERRSEAAGPVCYLREEEYQDWTKWDIITDAKQTRCVPPITLHKVHHLSTPSLVAMTPVPSCMFGPRAETPEAALLQLRRYLSSNIAVPSPNQSKREGPTEAGW
ncbi:hypothetical protein J6590_015623 [Homalodisca vitripennis]|nr:hypothetical protein J6590_015623 [Homalodisca vitripennis]